MKKVLVLTAALAGCAPIPEAPATQSPATQGEGHAFGCQAGFYWRPNEPIVVIAKIDADGAAGEITAAGRTHWAAYSLSGFNRRWDFDLQPDGTFDYALTVEPSGEARYYDFSNAEPGESVSPAQHFFCKQTN